MATFFDTLIATIALGSLYALVALGYTLVYGVLKFINFAHSDIFVLGAWTSFTSAVAVTTLLDTQGVPPWWVGALVLMLAVLVCATTGYLIERLAYRPLRKAPRLNVLITAIGVSLLLQNVGQLPGYPVVRENVPPAAATADASAPAAQGQTLATLPFGPTPRSMPQLLPNAVLNDSAVASGTITAGSGRGQVRLDQPIEILPDRQYALVVTRTVAGEPRTTTFRLVGIEGGRIEAGTDIGTQPRRDPRDFENATYRLVLSPVVALRLIDVLIVVSSIALMIVLQYVVFHTRLGSAMRALSFNTETAALMGINVNRVISITFVMGTALAAAAAFLYTQKYTSLSQPASAVWVLLGLKAFVAAVVGGIGNVRGAVLGGFLIAGLELFGSTYSEVLITAAGGSSGIGTALRDIYVFGLLILVLLVRPAGILGTVTREKV